MADLQADNVGNFVRLRMASLNLSTRELAKRLGHKSNTMVGGVTARPPRKTIPMTEAEEWANALRVEGEQRQHFFRLVMMETLPEYVLAEFQRLRQQYRDLELECEDLKAVVVREFIRTRRGSLTPPEGAPALTDGAPPAAPEPR